MRIVSIVDRKTFDMVQIIRSLKDLHKGSCQYPYYDRIVCPICGRKMVRSCSQEHGHPPVWQCTPDDDFQQCQRYYVKEEYINEAFREAYEGLEIEVLQKQANKRDADITAAAEWAITLKKELHTIEKVEYYMLDALVEKIQFQKWDILLVDWKFGLKTKVQIHYIKNQDVPNHKEQLEICASQRKVHMGETTAKRYNYHNLERPNVYGYDSIVSCEAENGGNK